MSKTRGKPTRTGNKNGEQFQNIFKSSAIELANEELRNWRSSLTYVQKLLKNKKNLTNMTKVIQKELISKDKNANEGDQPVYFRVQTGLFYLSIICEDQRLADVRIAQYCIS